MKLIEIVKRTEVDYEYMKNMNNRLAAIALITIAFTIYFGFVIYLLISLAEQYFDIEDDALISFLIQFMVVAFLTTGFWSYYFSELKIYSQFKLIYDVNNMQIDEKDEIKEPKNSASIEEPELIAAHNEEINIEANESENCAICGTPYRFIPEEEIYWCDKCNRQYP